MNILHLTASPFYGGPERVICDIVRTQSSLVPKMKHYVLSFSERGGCHAFLAELEKLSLSKYCLNFGELTSDMPHLFAAYQEIVRFLRREKIDIICSHGYKSRFLGYFAAKRVGIPIIGVSHGWTWQDWKTSCYDRLDQWMHRRMNHVVCVSHGQAAKVRRCGVSPERISVIHNAIDVSRFSEKSDSIYRKQLELYFETESPRKIILGAAGRLSHEKGYDVLIDAIEYLVEECRSDESSDISCETPVISSQKSSPKWGLVIFGDGARRELLQDQINRKQLHQTIKLAGFTSELDQYIPHFDIFVQSSRTEGFPCVNLEAMAARVPVVATSVGGVPEQIESGQNGILVPPNDPKMLAEGLKRLIDSPELRTQMGNFGRERVEKEFTCDVMAKHYFNLFEHLIVQKRAGDEM
ncbi:MAG: glycosyltransferase family 4 protein [Thermoguttaceae bacterium]